MSLSFPAPRSDLLPLLPWPWSCQPEQGLLHPQPLSCSLTPTPQEALRCPPIAIGESQSLPETMIFKALTALLGTDPSVSHPHLALPSRCPPPPTWGSGLSFPAQAQLLLPGPGHTPEQAGL